MPPTVSGLERAMACLASELLPHDESADTDFRRAGTVVHAFLRDCNLVGREEALVKAPPEHRAALEQIDVERYPVDGERFAPEVSYQYDTETEASRELARGDDSRAYPGGWYLYGTADVVGLTPDAVVVVDYKGPHATLTPAASNWQLLGYSLMAARAYGRSKALGALVRVRPGAPPFFDHAEFGVLELDYAAHAIRELFERLRVATHADAKPKEGPWCRWCPAFNRCPAKTSLAVALGRGEFPAVPIDAGNAAAVYERLQAAKAVLARVESVLEEWAVAHPVQLGGGWVYGMKEAPRESIDPLLAEPILEAAGLTGAVVRKVTKDGLEEEIRRKLDGKRGVAPKLREVMGALRSAGAATTSHIPTVTKFRPKPGELPADRAQKPDELRAQLEANLSTAAAAENDGGNT